MSDKETETVNTEQIVVIGSNAFSDSSVKSLYLEPDTSSDERTIYVELDKNGIPNVVLGGVWSGRLLMGAIRAIEKQYRLRKLSARREALAKPRS